MSFIDGAVDAATQLLGDAAAPYALFTQASRYIGTLFFDVTTREVHSDEDTITVHPVETGTPISDHVFANPQTIEISCASSDSTAGYSGYVQNVYQAILALKATREPFDVSTGKRFYTSMLIGAVTVVTDVESEFALMVTMRLQQVIITSTSNSGSSNGMTTANQADPADTAPESASGNQNLEPAPSISFDQAQGSFGAAPAPAAIGETSTVPTFAQGFNT